MKFGLFRKICVKFVINIQGKFIFGTISTKPFNP